VDAKLLGQGPGVDPGDPGNAVFLEPAVERLTRCRVGRFFAEFRNNVAGNPGPVGLKARRVDAVIADERIGLAENLAVIGRIGDALRVADDSGVENDFPPDLYGRAEAYALEDSAVREGQNRVSDGACLRLIFALV
jgi:hypothetical protein